jgi:hypothetical protein
MIKFKNKKDIKLFCSLHPILIMIYADLFWYAKEKHNVELVITETVSTPKQDKKLGRVSKSHQFSAACDIRTKDLDVFVLEDILNYINNKKEYKKYHYLSRSGARRLAYYHIGSHEHIHLALHSKYFIKK